MIVVNLKVHCVDKLEAFSTFECYNIYRQTKFSRWKDRGFGWRKRDKTKLSCSMSLILCSNKDNLFFCLKYFLIPPCANFWNKVVMALGKVGLEEGKQLNNLSDGILLSSRFEWQCNRPSFRLLGRRRNLTWNLEKYQLIVVQRLLLFCKNLKQNSQRGSQRSMRGLWRGGWGGVCNLREGVGIPV